MTQQTCSPFRARPGCFRPLGATVMESGVHFALVSRHATRVWLCIFADDGSGPIAEFELEPDECKKGDIWSIFVEGASNGTPYMYRVDGLFEPRAGHRYDPSRYLLDPYAKRIMGHVWDNTARCLVTAGDYDWGDDRPPRVPLSSTVIYEVHVKGLTAHPSSGVTHPGTYRGLIEKIPYLKEIGVTAVELLPVHHCGERPIKARKNPNTGEPLFNYWGYQPIGYFAPDGWYASGGGNGEQLDEFRDMVKALHAAGIEVIVDVVFNHTAESVETEPNLCFRGIDNTVYYHVDREGKYKNFTGCGNSVNCNHPIVREFIMDCLHYWVNELHVDGFRFDLASVLNRDRYGNLLQNAPIVEQIAEDPLLCETKLIAEPWDVAGAFQLGAFGEGRWAEWNSRFRDDVRRFWRGDVGMKGDFAKRITGSPDLFQDDGRGPQHSINYITAHDGFTLHDLVSYNRKHNADNGECNRDGMDENFSWNCGAEGEDDDPLVVALRSRMRKNFLATLFLSIGVPMLLGGDEFGRTQRGNNNAYCQDNEISWFDWALAQKNADLLRFCKSLIRFRRENPVFTRETFFTGKPSREGAQPDILWFDAAGQPQQWFPHDPALACRIDPAENSETALYMIFNPSNEMSEFVLPKGVWRLRINTAQVAPFDFWETENAPEISSKVRVGQKSLVVLTQQ
ncbi:MAG TPA: glycogen debranching protein GlgX [Candidatus Hydrogenedentes bacterium]|nr:glycogen debranching protein GlgX [Candidatus Hydrogenedentota bacterium]HOL77328.1 glycogen debranching protein GlgX [Candidatus Hydrogenedentota bacterium]HPO85970.1 glycogen debranching protein GlgX [Candidatus Hydrogenedentota bacterium]